MANSISLFKKYIDLLDEVYKQSSLTSVFDGNNALVHLGANANELIIVNALKNRTRFSD